MGCIACGPKGWSQIHRCVVRIGSRLEKKDSALVSELRGDLVIRREAEKESAVNLRDAEDVAERTGE